MAFVIRRAPASAGLWPTLPPMVVVSGGETIPPAPEPIWKTMRHRYAIRWSRLSELVALSASVLAIAAVLAGFV